MSGLAGSDGLTQKTCGVSFHDSHSLSEEDSPCSSFSIKG